MNIVEPMDTAALAALRAKVKGHKTYRPSDQMAINLERSASVYPHSLKTVVSVGIGTERKHGYARGR